MEYQCNSANLPGKILPAVIDGAAWKKVTEGKAGVRWGGVVEKAWKEIMWGYKT